MKNTTTRRAAASRSAAHPAAQRGTDPQGRRPAGRGSLRRGLLSALAAVAAAAGPLPQLAHADTAPPPAEVTIPGVAQPGPTGQPVYRAGATGYLVQQPGADTQHPDYVWHAFDGTVRDVGYLSAPRLIDDGQRPPLLGAASGTGPFQIYDVGAGRSTDYALPANQWGMGIFPTDSDAGWVGVSQTPVVADDGTTTGYFLHLLTPGGNGTFSRDVVIGGQPAEGVDSISWKVVRGAVFMAYSTAGERRVGLVDTDHAELTWSTAAAVGQSGTLALSHGYAAYRVGSTVTVRAQADPSTVVRDIVVGGGEPSLALTGDALLTSPGPSGIWTTTHEPLLAYPLAGGPSATLAGDAGLLLQSEDAGYVFDTATPGGGYGTYRVASDGGTPQLVRKYATYQPQAVGLSLAGGLLSRVETVPGSEPYASMRSYTVGAHAYPWSPEHRGDDETGPMSGLTDCGDGTACVRLTATDDYPGRVTLVRDTSGHDVLATGPRASDAIVSLGSSGGRVVSAGLHYVLYDSGASGMQSLIDTRTRRVVSTRPAVASALWGGTWWSATATPGVLTVADSATGTISRTVATDAPCVPDEIQVLGRWVYWSCADGGPAGVWDSTTGRSVTTGTGKALLGDGFVVRHVDNSLVLTDVHTGTAQVRTIAPLAAMPSTDDRDVTWTVDKSRGFIAYTDASLTTHVVTTGVPYSPIAVLWSDVPADVTTGGDWDPYWRLTGPTVEWRVELRRKGSTTIVASPTVTAGADAEQDVRAVWDGHGADGRVLPDGAYTWTLTAPPADQQGPTLVTSGTVVLHGGAPRARDYTGDGAGDLLALTSGGSLDLRPGTGTTPGALRATSSSAAGWPSNSLLVPAGDMNGDGADDLLVRDASGHLTRYDGTSGRAFGPTGTHHLIGAGWNVYDSLVSQGDLNGDGRPDLLVRTPSGDLYFYAGDAAGEFAPRMKIGFGYQIYSVIAGVQDLNGDGVGDVLARDTAGVLWRYDGDGKGGLTARVRIGAGWGVYDSLVGVGDLNADGRDDLVARDTAGDLWRYSGLGNGLFAPRVKIGWAWQTYKALL
jgi:FG-GAP-like repeat